MVSIIIPCYNQAQYLGETLQSVLVQTHQDWECVIVNDGSPDNTEEVAQEWCKKDTRFVYVKKENGGLSDARNYGITHSKGTYILPLDSDDYISENYVEECLKTLLKSESTKLVYGKAVKFGAENGVWELPEYSFEKLIHRNMIFCTALYRKEDWKRIGGYDTNMKEGWEDWEFWINLLKDGGTAIAISTCTFYYRTNDSSMILDLIHSKQKMNRLIGYIFAKHSKLYSEHTFHELFLLHNESIHNLTYLDEYLSYKELNKIYKKKLKASVKSFLIQIGLAK